MCKNFIDKSPLCHIDLTRRELSLEYLSAEKANRRPMRSGKPGSAPTPGLVALSDIRPDPSKHLNVFSAGPSRIFALFFPIHAMIPQLDSTFVVRRTSIEIIGPVLTRRPGSNYIVPAALYS